MEATTSNQLPLRPLITAEQMEKILSERRPISSEEAYRQIEEHLGRPPSATRKKVSVNGRKALVSC